MVYLRFVGSRVDVENSLKFFLNKQGQELDIVGSPEIVPASESQGKFACDLQVRFFSYE